MLPKTRLAYLTFLALCTLVLAVAPPGVNPAMAAPEDVALFQDVLSSYGQWLNYGHYGPVWRPAQVNRNWRPYTNGRWVPSQEGYVFETDEPWGWATYHYGNWLPTNEHGWLWVPGRTWYPHTVNWRSNDDNVGWAPVPPPEPGGADMYAPGGYADGGYGYSPGQNASGSLLNPLSWIFLGVRDFLLGWGQPYSSMYSYASAGVLASPQYIPTIYERTVYVNNYVSPSYAPAAYYNWGPPVTYITRVTNINNIEIQRRCKDLRLDQLRNVAPPAHVRHRHPAWREVWPAAAANRNIQVRPVAHHNIAPGRLNRPDALPPPSSLHRQQAEMAAPHGVSGRPQPPDTARNRAFSAGTPPAPDTRRAWGQPPASPQVVQPSARPRAPYPAGPDVTGAAPRDPAGRPAPVAQNPPPPHPRPGDQISGPQTPTPPPSRSQDHRRRQPLAPAAAREHQLRRPQAPSLQPDQQQAEPALRLRQQQRLALERRPQEAGSLQIPPAPAQAPGQPPAPVAQPRPQAEAPRPPHLQQPPQADLQRRHQAEQQRQQQIQQQQQQRQAVMQRQQQQLMQQRQAEMQRQAQAQQQRQAEMMQARQMQQQQQQQQVVRPSPPPPPPPQAPPPPKKPDNQKKT